MTDHHEPWQDVDRWWHEAESHPAIRYAHAAVLATVDLDRDPPCPDARVVLIHAWSPEGFVLSSDEASPKVTQIQRCPTAALNLHWSPLERQVRIRGAIERLDDAVADRCFAERPRDSRITAWASRQGPGLADRDTLDKAWKDAARRFADVDDVPRPPHWRGG